MEPDRDIVLHYEDRYDEDGRLSKSGLGRLELIRTQLLLERYLPTPPASILDVGSGPGVYARWLTAAGYQVELVDIVPRHIKQATARGLRAQLGDARDLPSDDDSQDAVLLLGPLYHLIERSDRIGALREAVRVGRPGAPILAAAISRYAPAIDGLASGYWDDPAFVDIVLGDLEHGTHFNTTGDPAYFTTAFFHRPEDLAEDLAEAGLVDTEILPVEGIGWSASDLDERMDDATKRDELLRLLDRLEHEPSILGASPHLLGVGHVPK